MQDIFTTFRILLDAYLIPGLVVALALAFVIRPFGEWASQRIAWANGWLVQGLILFGGILLAILLAIEIDIFPRDWLPHTAASIVFDALMIVAFATIIMWIIQKCIEAYHAFKPEREEPSG